MFLLILLVVHQSLALQGHSSDSDRPNVTSHVMQQPLDHFNEKDNRTWNMWYFQRLDFWKPGAPLFVVTSSFDIAAYGRNLYTNYTFYVNLAAELGAGLVNVQARYSYLAKIPNKNMRHYEYMTTKQSLEDLARVVRAYRARPEFSSSKVVVMGPSYAGTLAVWFRMKYPELADAAYASGAPLLAVKSIPNFFKYVEEDMSIPVVYKNCYANSTEHYRRVDEDMKTADKKWIMKYIFYPYGEICAGTDMTDTNNLRTLMWMVFQNSYYFVGSRFEYYCENLFPNSWHHGLQSNVSGYCQDIVWTHTVERYLSLPYLHARATFYPQCREFGHFLLPTDGYHPFGRSGKLAYEFQLMLCLLLFGIEEADIDEHIRETNEEFGGLEPNVSRVILVSGEFAANRDLFLREDRPNDVLTYTIPGTYAYDETDAFMYRERDYEITLARKWVAKTLKSWIYE